MHRRPRSETTAPGTQSQQFARRRGQERGHMLLPALVGASAQVAADMVGSLVALAPNADHAVAADLCASE